MKYQLELNYNNIAIEKLPDNKNIFIYGTGGAGKTTLLMNQIGNGNTVSFYFPLYQYRREIHENFQSGSCWILLQILLKYHYQYEYQTYETLIAIEGESAVLQQLTELDKILKSTPVNGQPGYTLLLDGLNEMSSELQRDFIGELEWIYRNWRNVRIIITGRTVPVNETFADFKHIEVGGVTDSDLDNALSENGKSVIHNNLICGVDFSILNLPLRISSDIRFSLNGEYPRDFSNTRVYRAAVCDDTQADNFKNCSFSGARFLDAEVKETLHKMGAVVDFEDDNFMDSLYRDILLPWTDF